MTTLSRPDAMTYLRDRVKQSAASSEERQARIIAHVEDVLPANPPTTDAGHWLAIKQAREEPPRRMAPPSPDSARGIVLAVAREMEGPFSFGKLLLRCWRKDPAAFGLARFWSKWPDARKLQTILYGRRGLIARGLLKNAGEGRYEVVGEG